MSGPFLKFKQLSPSVKAAWAAGLLFLLAALCIWPLGLFGGSVETKESAPDTRRDSEVLTKAFAIRGSFVGTGKTLSALGLRMAGINDGMREGEGSLILTLSGEDGSVLASAEVFPKDLKNNEYASFPLKVPLSQGETYTWELRWSGEGEGPWLQLGSPDSAPWENLYGWYEAAPTAPIYPLISFSYAIPMTFEAALPCWILLALGLILVLGALGIFRTGALPFLLPAFLAFFACSFLLLTDESRIPVRLTGRQLENLTGGHDYDYVGINEAPEKCGTMARTREYTLNPGTYRVGVGYACDTPYNTICVYDNGTLLQEYALDPAWGYREIELELPRGSRFFSLDFNYSGQGYLIINSFTLTPGDRFYTDHLYLCAAILIVTLGAMVTMGVMKKRGLALSPKVMVTGAFILLLSVFAMHPWFTGYLGYGDDVCYHLIRIEGTKEALLSGQFPAVLYPEAVQGKGFLGWMYPSLFLYFPALLRILGVSLSLSWKSLVFVFHLLTAWTSYYAVKRITGLRRAGFFASALYTLSPYRLTCFMARAALGEALAFAFFPLVAAGLWLLLYAPEGAEKKKSGEGVACLAAGFTGLLQSHLLSVLMAFIFCVLLGILRLAALIREKRFIPVLKAAGLTLCLNLWYLLPFLEFYTSAGLNTEALGWSGYREYSLLPLSVFGTLTGGDYRLYALGLPILGCLAAYLLRALWQRLSCGGGKNAETAERTAAAGMTERTETAEATAALCSFLAHCAALGIGCLCLTLWVFPSRAFMDASFAFKNFFMNLQFPWRLLGPAGLFMIISGAAALFMPVTDEGAAFLKKAFPVTGICLGILACVMVTRYDTSGGDYYAYESFESKYTQAHYLRLIGIPKGPNTIVYPYEWMPEGAGEQEALTSPQVSFVPGDTAPAEYSWSRTGTSSRLDYLTGDEPVSAEAILPLFSYPFYEVTDEAGSAVTVQRTSGGLMKTALNPAPGSHTIFISYRPPLSLTLGLLATALSLLALLALLTLRLFRPKNCNRGTVKPGDGS